MNSTISYQVALFVGSLVLAGISSIVLAGCIDRIGARFRLTEGLAGLLTALGANSSEIATAVVALVGKKHDIGFGVILGSNLFNLAALLGLSAVVSGLVIISTRVALLNGTVAAVMTAAAIALLHGWIGTWLILAVTALIFIPYVIILTLKPMHLARLPVQSRLVRLLRSLVHDTEQEARKDQTAPRGKTSDFLTLVPALASVVYGSIGMVDAGEFLGHTAGLSDPVIGMLVLAALTGIPNVLAAIRLSRRGRGAAVVSEALNSNSLNIVAGIFLPILLLGMGTISPHVLLAGWLLLGVTILSTILLISGRGMTRAEGIVTICLYFGFVVLVCFW